MSPLGSLDRSQLGPSSGSLVRLPACPRRGTLRSMNSDRWGVHPCSIEDCPERRVSRGWCAKHYQRFLRLGDPLGPVRPYKRSSGPALPRPSRLCSVEACGRRHFGRGLCAHSTRNDGDARPITNETGNPPGLEGRGVSIVLILGFVLGGSQKDAVGEPMVGVQNKR
jgi:hypothetical protein